MIFNIRTLLLLCLFFPLLLPAQVIRSVDESTDLKSWKLLQNGFELQIIQRLPDQTRGFFQARGFSAAQANDIATQCVMQTSIKNSASQAQGLPVSVALKDWQVSVNAKLQSVKLKEDWAKQWAAIKDADLQVKQAAKIAFRWSTFPTEQSFEANGDYNWGMISFGLKPGTVYDLHVFWKIDGQIQSDWIMGIECAQDL